MKPANHSEIHANHDARFQLTLNSKIQAHMLHLDHPASLLSLNFFNVFFSWTDLEDSDTSKMLEENLSTKTIKLLKRRHLYEASSLSALIWIAGSYENFCQCSETYKICRLVRVNVTYLLLLVDELVSSNRLWKGFPSPNTVEVLPVFLKAKQKLLKYLVIEIVSQQRQ